MGMRNKPNARYENYTEYFGKLILELEDWKESKEKAEARIKAIEERINIMEKQLNKIFEIDFRGFE